MSPKPKVLSSLHAGEKCFLFLFLFLLITNFFKEKDFNDTKKEWKWNDYLFLNFFFKLKFYRWINVRYHLVIFPLFQFHQLIKTPNMIYTWQKVIFLGFLMKKKIIVIVSWNIKTTSFSVHIWYIWYWLIYFYDIFLNNYYCVYSWY